MRNSIRALPMPMRSDSTSRAAFELANGVIKRRPAPPPQAPSTITTGDGTRLRLDVAHILLIDDDDVDRERVKRYLGKTDLRHEIVDATSGDEALHRLSNEEFDLILLDYQLGDMTGFDLLRRLQRHEITRAPIIMITGGGDENLAVEALHQGIADYIPKRSLNADTLRIAAQNAMRLRDIERELESTQQRLLRLSMYDELTGLPNRWLFFDRLDQMIARAERQGENFSLFMIDLNLFKEVNDYHGHASGDRVLAQIGERLKQVARKCDTVARLGGDEFACLLANAHSDIELDVCASKLHASICQPISLGHTLVHVGAAIGIARYRIDGQDRDTLMARADAAMYSAKASHRRYVLFDEQHRDNRAITPGCQSLREGIERGELYLEYQPQILLASTQVVGLEALVRWQSPTYGVLRPNDFIPIAESSGLISELTREVLTIGFEQLSMWRASGLVHPVSFNISARLLDDGEWIQWMLNEMRHQGLAPSDVILEITETAISSSNANQRKHLEELSDRGFQLSVDDFGTGFTSFKSIREWLPAEVKIDRLFVHDVKDGSSDASIIQSIVTLANNLGIRLVAEGIETQAEQDFLVRSGCECGQGFAIAPPMNAEDATAWLTEKLSSSETKH